MAEKRNGAACSVGVCSGYGKVHSRGNTHDRRARRANIIAAHGAACAWCAVVTEELEMDRIVPGCMYAAWNIVPSCRACNNRRDDVSFEAFLKVCDAPGYALRALAIASTFPAQKRHALQYANVHY